MRFSIFYLTIAVILSVILVTSVSANAQMPPGMSGMPKMTTGKYVNAKFGIEVTIPNGFQGMENVMDAGVIVSIMPSFDSMGSGGPPVMDSMTVGVFDKAKMEAGTKNANIPDKYKDACKTKESSKKTINGLEFNVNITECDFGTKTWMKTYTVEKDGLTYSATLTSMSGEPSANVGTFDKMVESFKTSKSGSQNTAKDPADAKKIADKKAADAKKIADKKAADAKNAKK